MTRFFLLPILCLAVISVSACTRFNELEPYEGEGENTVLIDEEARAQNKKDASDPRPYGGIFGEGFAK